MKSLGKRFYFITMTVLLVTRSIGPSQLTAAPKEDPFYATASRFVTRRDALPTTLSAQTEREAVLQRFITPTDFDHLRMHPMVQRAQESRLFHTAIETERKAARDKAQEEVQDTANIAGNQASETVRARGHEVAHAARSAVYEAVGASWHETASAVRKAAYKAAVAQGYPAAHAARKEAYRTATSCSRDDAKAAGETAYEETLSRYRNAAQAVSQAVYNAATTQGHEVVGKAVYDAAMSWYDDAAQSAGMQAYEAVIDAASQELKAEITQRIIDEGQRFREESVASLRDFMKLPLILKAIHGNIYPSVSCVEYPQFATWVQALPRTTVTVSYPEPPHKRLLPHYDISLLGITGRTFMSYAIRACNRPARETLFCKIDRRACDLVTYKVHGIEGELSDALLRDKIIFPCVITTEPGSIVKIHKAADCVASAQHPDSGSGTSDAPMTFGDGLSYGDMLKEGNTALIWAMTLPERARNDLAGLFLMLAEHDLKMSPVAINGAVRAMQNFSDVIEHDTYAGFLMKKENRIMVSRFIVCAAQYFSRHQEALLREIDAAKERGEEDCTLPKVLSARSPSIQRIALRMKSAAAQISSSKSEHEPISHITHESDSEDVRMSSGLTD